MAEITFWSCGSTFYLVAANSLCSLGLHCTKKKEQSRCWWWKKASALSAREVKSITIKKVFLERPGKLCLWGLSTKMTSKLCEFNVMASAGKTGLWNLPHMFSCCRKLTPARFLGQPLATLLHNRVQNSLDWIKRLPRRLWIPWAGSEGRVAKNAEPFSFRGWVAASFPLKGKSPICCWQNISPDCQLQIPNSISI